MNITLSPEETGYLLGLIKEHLEYYKMLSGHAKGSERHKRLYKMLNDLSIRLTTSKEGVLDSAP